MVENAVAYCLLTVYRLVDKKSSYRATVCELKSSWVWFDVQQ